MATPEEQAERARELGLPTDFVGCNYCANCSAREYQFHALCAAPQLKGLLEDAGTVIAASACRDLTALCGANARWFKKREN